MQQIRVSIRQHEKTGLLIATSEDLRGLYAHGRTMEDLEAAVAIAIKDILEAKLQRSVEVSKRSEERLSAFVPTELTFAANGAIAA